MNINTKEYWNNRFKSGNWEKRNGREQTKIFAKSHIPRLRMNKDFSGTILDFGCGLGDAIPLYKEAFPKAELIGIDISESAIDKCREVYGDIATFMVGSHLDVPDVDVIISSHVFEHLSNDKDIAKHIRSKCKEFYIFTPYNEHIFYGYEHVNSYQQDYYKDVMDDYKTEVFKVKGHSESFLERLYQIYFKNFFRKILRKITARPRLLIMFYFKS